MTGITESVLQNNLPAVFTAEELKKICPNDNVRYCQMRRAMKNGEIVRITKGLYVLGNLFRRQPVDKAALSQRIDPASYVSMLSALYYYDWIPEIVYRCNCVTSGKSRDIRNPLVNYSYKRVVQKDYEKGVRTVNFFGTDFKMATPLKALADYVAWMGLDWNSSEPLTESLRIEEECLEDIKPADFDELQGNYLSYPNVEKFLAGVRRELCL